MGNIRKILEGVPANAPFRKYTIYDEADEFVKRFTDDQVDEMIDFIKSNEDAVFLYVNELSSQATGFSKTPKYESHLFWERDVDSFDKLEELRPVKESLNEGDSFYDIVKKAYNWFLDVRANKGESDTPTDGEIADFIVNHAEEWPDLDVSHAMDGPIEFNKFCASVRDALIHLGLDYVLEESKLIEKIKKNGDKWEIWSKDGSKKLGTFDTEEEAKERLRAIEFFKHKNESKLDDGEYLDSLAVEGKWTCVFSQGASVGEEDLDWKAETFDSEADAKEFAKKKIKEIADDYGYNSVTIFDPECEEVETFTKEIEEAEEPIDIEALEFYVKNWNEGDNITVTADLLNVLEKALKMAKQYSLKESHGAVDDYLKKFKKNSNDEYYVLDDEIDQVNREIADFGYTLHKASHGPGPGEWYYLTPIEDSERPVDED